MSTGLPGATAAAKNDISPATTLLKEATLPRTILVKAGSAPILSAAEQREALKQKQALIRRLERQEEEILAELGALETEKPGLTRRRWWRARAGNRRPRRRN
jgi:hypothetical protein